MSLSPSPLLCLILFFNLLNSFLIPSKAEPAPPPPTAAGDEAAKPPETGGTLFFHYFDRFLLVYATVLHSGRVEVEFFQRLGLRQPRHYGHVRVGWKF